jgi:dihydrodipicolinate synthase/N-acetylneuraminate lyase
VVQVAGICGETRQAVKEASLARTFGYHAGLLSLGALRDASDEALIAHVCEVGQVIPVIGFYLQPAVGGRHLSYEFWRRFASLESVVAIKIAPFSRYETQSVIRGVADSGRAEEIALYTGNDDHIILDLAQTFMFGRHQLRFAGGLLGHWAFGTRRAVEQHRALRAELEQRQSLGLEWLRLAAQVTDMNAAVFDALNGFRGCIPGINEVLRRQGLLSGRECIDPDEGLSAGQMAEIDRVMATYPHLTDDSYIRENLDRWMR